MLTVQLQEPSRITLQEICARLNLCRTTVLEMLQAGQIPGMKTPGGGRWLVSRVRFYEWERTFGDTPCPPTARFEESR